MGMLHPSEFRLIGPYSVSTQSVTMGNGTLDTPYIARTLLFTVHNSKHFTGVQKNKQLFFHEGRKLIYGFWGNVTNSNQILVTC
jgi:hypothetical protein